MSRERSIGVKDGNEVPDALNCIFYFQQISDQSGDDTACFRTLEQASPARQFGFSVMVTRSQPHDLLLSFCISQSVLLCQVILGRISFAQCTQSSVYHSIYRAVYLGADIAVHCSNIIGHNVFQCLEIRPSL